MKRIINVIKKLLASYTPHITIWTVTIYDRKTYVTIERLLFLRYSSAEKAFNKYNELIDEDAKKYALDNCSIILGGEPLWFYYNKLTDEVYTYEYFEEKYNKN